MKSLMAKDAKHEDPDEYRVQYIFWVPPEARWAHLRAQTTQPTIGRPVEDATTGIQRDNLALAAYPKNYACPALDKTQLWTLRR